MIDTGFKIEADIPKLEFRYGEDVYGSVSEKRKLDDIRKSLSDPEV